MQERKKLIFRSESWRRYLARQEAAVFPRLVTPRSLVVLWLSLALVIATSLAILLKETPVYSSGAAVVVSRDESVSGEIVFAVLLPGTPPQTIRPGNAGQVEASDDRPPITGSIIEVEKARIGLSEAASRFGLPADASSKIQFPASVVFLRITSGGHDLLRSDNRNVVYQAQVQSGTQRAISYVISGTTRE
ncbi:MAG TPA: hypothetical protein VJ810_33530 [Blastocatellia bacterium]|nr:hypothetical protein [Blastocatellia bacterium]